MEVEIYMNDEARLQICRTLYRFGVYLLPIVWFLNAVWFYYDAFIRPPFPQQRHFKQYVVVCLVGSLIWSLVFTAWAAVQHIRSSVHETILGILSFIRPLSHA